MKPSKGKRMWLAVCRARFSRWLLRSGGPRIRMDRNRSPSVFPTVALLAGARQRGLIAGFKVLDKVGRTPSGPGCYRSWTYGPRSTEDCLRCMPFLAKASSRRSAVECGGLRAVRCDCRRSLGRVSCSMRQGRWRRNGLIRPVLKHGPRSLTCVRVFE